MLAVEEVEVEIKTPTFQDMVLLAVVLVDHQVVQLQFQMVRQDFPIQVAVVVAVSAMELMVLLAATAALASLSFVTLQQLHLLPQQQETHKSVTLVTTKFIHLHLVEQSHSDASLYLYHYQ
jgi:hypothetical protein